MNQLPQPDRPETVFEKAYATTAYAFDSALFWLEDNWRPVIGSLSAAVLITTAWASVSNQNAINEDGIAVHQAALQDGIEVESIASGIRAGKVLADIAIGSCRVTDSMLTVGYQGGVLQVDDYTVPIAITTDGIVGSQALHIGSAGELQNIPQLLPVCD